MVCVWEFCTSGVTAEKAPVLTRLTLEGGTWRRASEDDFRKQSGSLGGQQLSLQAQRFFLFLKKRCFFFIASRSLPPLEPILQVSGWVLRRNDQHHQVQQRTPSESQPAEAAAGGAGDGWQHTGWRDAWKPLMPGRACGPGCSSAVGQAATALSTKHIRLACADASFGSNQVEPLCF